MNTKLVAVAVAVALIAGYAVAMLRAPGAEPAPAPAKTAPAAPAASAPAVAHDEPVEADDDEVEFGANPAPTAADRAAWDAPPEEPPSEGPVSVQFERELGASGTPYTYVVLQAKTDSTEVRSVQLNRGNCMASLPNVYDAKLPRTLKFGDSLRLRAIGCESVLEVSVDTDAGEFVFRAHG